MLIREILHPDFVDYFKEQWSDLLAGKVAQQYEFCIIDPEGNERWILQSNQGIFDDNGNIIAIEGICRDITERKQAEEALRESEERLHSVVETSPDHILMLDTDLKIQFANYAWPGLTVEELIGTPIYHYVEEEQQAEIKAILEGVVRTGTPARYETEYHVSDGNVMYYESRVAPQRRSGSDEIIGLTMNARDITEQKQSEEALFYRLQVEKMANGIAASFVNTEMTEIDEIITSVLEAIARFAGVNRSSLFLLSDDLETITNTHEWCKSPEDSQIALLQDIPFSTFGYHREELLQHRTISISKLEDFPPTAKGERVWMEEHGFRSLLFIPLLKQRKLRGTLGFYGGTGEVVTWPTEFVDMLKITGNLLLNVLERQQAENNLIESERRYRGLFENMPVGFVLFEVVQDDKGVPVDLIIIAANNGFVTTTGLNTQEVIGKRLMRVLPGIENDAADWIRTYGKIALTGEPRQFEQGSELLGYYYSITAYQAGPKQCAVTFLDITERKQAAEKVKQQQYYLEKAQELGQIGTWELDIRANKLYWTDENCRIFGVPTGSVVNYEIFLEKIYPDDREYVDREWSAALEGKPYDIEHRLNTDGITRWVREKADVEFNEEGVAVKAIGFTQDITERKQAEENLRYERMRAQQYLDVAGVMLIALGIDQRVTLINPKGCEILGYSEEEVLGQNWFDKFLPEDNIDAVKRVFEQIVSGDIEPVRYYENPIARKDGSMRTIAWHNSVLHDASGRISGLFSSGEDITERKHMEQELIRLERLRAVGELSAGVSHNLNNILTNVLGPAQLLKRKTDDPELLREVDDIVTSAVRARDLVHELHLSVRTQEEESRHPVSVIKVIGEAVQTSRPRWKDEPEAQGVSIGLFKGKVCPQPKARKRVCTTFLPI